MIVESYVWRPGTRVKINPEVAGAELLRIKSSRGRITTDIVVREAIPKKHPFNAHIWGASKDEAEKEYRRIRAAEIIRGMVVISRPYEGGPPVEVPAFPNIKESEANNERQYLPIEEVYSNGELRAQLLKEFVDRIRNLRKIYGGLKELSEVWEAVDKVATR